MKKIEKLVILTLIFLMLIGTCIENFAVTLTTESLKKSIEGYTKGEKKATADFGETKLTVGGNSENQDIEVTDKTITMSGMTYNYVIENNNKVFAKIIEYAIPTIGHTVYSKTL